MLETRVLFVHDATNDGRVTRLGFHIGLGHKEVVIIKRLYITYIPVDKLAKKELLWNLIAKSEKTFLNAVDTTVDYLVDGKGGQVPDHDIISSGVFFFGTVATNVRNVIEPQMRDYGKEGIMLPRSPTIELRQDSAGNEKLRVVIELHYEKKAVSNAILIGLLKKWKGRKQDVVSNIPRVIDE